jgi:hypothetical protein
MRARSGAGGAGEGSGRAATVQRGPVSGGEIGQRISDSVGRALRGCRDRLVRGTREAETHPDPGAWVTEAVVAPPVGISVGRPVPSEDMAPGECISRRDDW